MPTLERSPPRIVWPPSSCSYPHVCGPPQLGGPYPFVGASLSNAAENVELDILIRARYPLIAVNQEKQVYKARLYFKEFAGLDDHITLKIRVDVTEYDRLHLPVQTRQRIPQYSDAADRAVPIQVVKLEEALADKLKCLLQRRYCFDLFDTVFAIFVANELSECSVSPRFRPALNLIANRISGDLRRFSVVGCLRAMLTPATRGSMLMLTTSRPASIS